MPEITILQRWITRFLEHLEIGKNKSKKTIENYHHYLQRFAGYYEKGDPSRLTLDDVHGYQMFLNRFADARGRGLGVKTQNYHLIALRAFLKYLVRQDIETLAPEKIDLKKIPERIVDFLTREEVERLFEVIDFGKRGGARDRAMLETLYSTGLRVSELVGLNRSQVDLERREFTVRGKDESRGLCFCRNAVFIGSVFTWRIGRTIGNRCLSVLGGIGKIRSLGLGSGGGSRRIRWKKWRGARGVWRASGNG